MKLPLIAIEMASFHFSIRLKKKVKEKFFFWKLVFFWRRLRDFGISKRYRNIVNRCNAMMTASQLSRLNNLLFVEKKSTRF